MAKKMIESVSSLGTPLAWLGELGLAGWLATWFVSFLWLGYELMKNSTGKEEMRIKLMRLLTACVEVM